MSEQRIPITIAFTAEQLGQLGLAWDSANQRLALGNAPSAADALTIAKSVNGPIGASVENTSSGADAQAMFYTLNNQGKLAVFGINGGGYSVGLLNGDSTWVACSERMVIVAGSDGVVPSDIVFAVGGVLDANEAGRIDSAKNASLGAGAVATNATDGFLYLPTCAGTPTGTPTAKTGYAPMVIDSTNNKAYAYIGGAWRALN